MTSSLFEKELQIWNRELKWQNRKVVLFVDNCTAHLRINLSNINLQFLPANTTSLIQPCDMGIIKNLKGHYRSRLFQPGLGSITITIKNKLSSNNIYSNFYK